jgi:hypothetical protein
VAAEMTPGAGRLTVAFDVTGGQFAWLPRKPIPLAELVSVHQDAARQLGFL